MKKFIVLFLLILTTGCANKMKPTDFKDQKPRLVIENYISGNVKIKFPLKISFMNLVF